MNHIFLSLPIRRHYFALYNNTLTDSMSVSVSKYADQAKVQNNVLHANEPSLKTHMKKLNWIPSNHVIITRATQRQQ